MQRKTKLILIAANAALVNTAGFAGDLMLWQDNSLSLLVGSNYELDPGTQQTVTFEHASGWSKGDLFLFVDGINFNGDKDITGSQTTYYGEFAPRLSLGKVMDTDLSVGIVKDFYIATCLEFGGSIDDHYLIGLGMDLAVPGFDFLQLNAYRRFDAGSSATEAYQITAVWKITIPVAKTEFVVDGFIDWVIGEGTDHLHICPQLKLDVGVLVGMEQRSLYAGIEYDYWKNKYGVKDGAFGLDSDQSTFSGLIKYHF
jgi:nucleoside-specific outer membrane channel protein Tsx